MTSYRQSDGDIIIFSNFSFRIATMVRLNGLGTRHTAQTKVLRKEIWQAVVIIALASLSVFLVSQQGQNSAPEKELKQTVLSTTRGFLKSQSKANECEAAVDRLVENKIRLAAIDFDATILDFHTGGRWKGSATDLIPHIRPEFRCFVSHCLGKGIQVAVATFSTQTGMIERVMKEAIPHPRSTEIHVFGGDDYVEGYSKGKQSQLLLAMNSFNDQEQVKSNGRAREPIIPSATILIDDDTDNIEVALEDGYKTFAFLPDTPSSFLHMSL